MFIRYKLNASGRVITFRFPYRIARGTLEKYWRPADSVPLQSNLSQADDHAFAVQTKLARLGEVLRSSAHVIERVDIAHRASDEMEIVLAKQNASDTHSTSVKFVLRHVTRAFCLPLDTI